MDIISLSLTLSEESSDVKDALDEASKHDVVVLCATADEGNNQLFTTLARAERAIAIAACDSYGKDLNFSQTSDVHFKVQGKDVLVGSVPFVASTEAISGSSVSTAIAAGLASLTLSCYRLAANKICSSGKKWRRAAVQGRFEKMSPRDRYIQPSLLVGLEEGRSRIPVLETDCTKNKIEMLIKASFKGTSLDEEANS